MSAAKKTTKVPRGRPVKPAAAKGIARTSVAILQRVADGETLMGARTYPHPHRFKISGVFGMGGADVALSVVDYLVSHHLIDAVPGDATRDTIFYAATDAGRQFLASPPQPDESQHDWVNETVLP